MSSPKLLAGLLLCGVLGALPDAEPRLITCSGPYDRRAGPDQRTVVFATAVS